MDNKAKAAAVAVVLVASSYVVDATQRAIPLACNLNEPQVVNIDEVVRNYRIDEGYLVTRSMTKNDRASIKGCEIVKRLPVGKFQDHDITVEIISTEPIDGGVQVFVRAWQNGKQIGFGKDGTVDIERFRVFNPPVLVDDANGSIERVVPVQDLDGTWSTTTRRLSENPELAIKQSLSHTIRVMYKHDFSKIIAGKIGNTTDTYYSASGDGGILGYQTESTPSQALWDELHDATTLGGSTASLISTTATNGDTYVNRTVYTSAVNSVQIGREFFPVDTSSLPDTDTIDSATFSVYGNYGGPTANITLGLVQTSQASVSSLVAGDWDTCGDAINNPTEGASRVTINSATAQYWTWTLNATGLTWVSKTGYTMLGLRTSDDMNDTLPSNPTDRRFNTYYSDYTGTANDPKLIVTHSAVQVKTTSRHVFW